MSTIKDVDKVTNLLLRVNIESLTNTDAREIRLSILALGSAIMEENNITDSAKVIELPKETLLGQRAEGALAVFSTAVTRHIGQ